MGSRRSGGKYAIDTQLYIELINTRSRRDRERHPLTLFSDRLAPAGLYFVAVVAAELLEGTRTPQEKHFVQRLQKHFGPLFVAPLPFHWTEAIDARHTLRKRQQITEEEARDPGFLNDILIALTCKEHGVTLVTRDTSDHARIQTVVHHVYCPPWPN